MKFLAVLFLFVFTACVSSKKHQSQIALKESEIESLHASQSDLKTSLEDLKKAYNEMLERRKEEQKRLAEFRELTERFKSLIDAGTLKVKIVDGKMVVSLGSDILFPSGSSQLSEAGNAAIREVAKELASIRDKDFQIEGHTDNVPIRSETYTNWDLASARAMSVLKLMIESGMPPARISAASYGETKPIADNSTNEGRALNRRIEIVVVPDLSGLPGYEELQKFAR